MADTVPSSLIAQKAYQHATKAAEALGNLTSCYSHEQRQIDAAHVSLAACIELMSLIQPPAPEASLSSGIRAEAEAVVSAPSPRLDPVADWKETQ